MLMIARNILRRWSSVSIAAGMALGCFIASPLNADEIAVESFMVGGVFQTGNATPSPLEMSTENQFLTSLPNQGRVAVENASNIGSGANDVIFTTSSTASLSRVDFDMGEQVEFILVPGSTLLGTTFTMSGINFDADAQDFVFQINGNFLDESQISSLAGLNVATTNSTYSASLVEGGLVEFIVSPDGGGEASISISGNGDILEAVNFREINPDVANDELTVGATRTFSFVTVPEPGAMLVVCLVGLGNLLTRRRSLS